MLNRLCSAAEFDPRRRLLGSIFNVLFCRQEVDESGRKAVKLPPPSATPHCQFYDVTVGTQYVTVLLENPVGCRVVEEGRKEEFARKLLQK